MTSYCDCYILYASNTLFYLGNIKNCPGVTTGSVRCFLKSRVNPQPPRRRRRILSQYIRLFVLNTLSDERKKVFALQLKCQPSQQEWSEFWREVGRTGIFKTKSSGRPTRRQSGIFSIYLQEGVEWEELVSRDGHLLSIIELPTYIINKVMSPSAQFLSVAR